MTSLCEHTNGIMIFWRGFAKITLCYNTKLVLLIIQWVGHGSARLSLKISWDYSVEGFVSEDGLLYLLFLLKQ